MSLLEIEFKVSDAFSSTQIFHYTSSLQENDYNITVADLGPHSCTLIGEKDIINFTKDELTKKGIKYEITPA